MKRIFIFTFLCLLYSCNVLNLDGSKPIIEIKDGAFDPNTGLDAWGYDPLSTTHVSAWNMGQGGDLTLILPITNSSSDFYDFTIDWGDGTVESIGSATTTGLDLRGSGYTTDISHTYTTAGIYTIKITGTFEGWSFYYTGVTSDDNDKLIRVHSFGDLGFESLHYAFKDCTNLNHFAGGYTSNVFSMFAMFRNTPSLSYLDLSSFNTTSVSNMTAMFFGASGLITLDLSSFDTSNLTSMANMFRDTVSLTTLELTSFETSNVSNMGSMFQGASSLTSLNLSSFDTTNVSNMTAMFSGASSLTSLNLSSFDTPSLNSMPAMFNGASSLNTLDLSNFNTSLVTNMNGIFEDATSLTSLNLTNWDTDPLPLNVDWIKNMSGTIICNDPDSGGVGSPGSGTVNGVACNLP